MHTRKWPLLGALIMALAVAVGVYATGPPPENKTSTLCDAVYDQAPALLTGGAPSALEKVVAAANATVDVTELVWALFMNKPEGVFMNRATGFIMHDGNPHDNGHSALMIGDQVRPARAAKTTLRLNC